MGGIVGSICVDSTTYRSIADVFKMNNLVGDIDKILSGKRTFVGTLCNDERKNVSVKFFQREDALIGIASCCGEKNYRMLQGEEWGTADFAWCYIDLLSGLAYNIRCKMVLAATVKNAHT